VQADLIRIAISPCSPRLAALGVSHFLVQPGVIPPSACTLKVTTAGSLQPWSRDPPVCPVGVAAAEPRDALDFDYACGAAARLLPAIHGFRFEAPADATKWWGIAVNAAVIARIDCAPRRRTGDRGASDRPPRRLGAGGLRGALPGLPGGVGAPAGKGQKRQRHRERVVDQPYGLMNERPV
jgi:hypothetical protein